jgi:NAD(P)-dependent dehydrogenase (short-subunit alcohol dehydrogenase family)
MRLRNKHAVITGGGSGIGKCTALLFAREGCAVAVVDRDEIAARDVVAVIKERGGTALAIAADVTRWPEVEAMRDRAVAELGRIDILYNNAGIEQPYTPLIETSDELWDREMTVNARSVFYCCRAIIPHMIRHGGGSIVNASSMLALIGAEGQGAYAASKAAVAQMTKVLALENARYGVRVNAVCATMIRTPMAERFLSTVQDREAWIATLERDIPLGRLGTPEDVAYAVLFLASDESALITGLCLPIDGGVYAK